ncbi:MAG TPA: oligosaccharide flippase family protein [Pyrinomonadaceae bacterium]|nr:oligosaccharide flippase family protein [Pyrinomonadaceae bacterium]
MTSPEIITDPIHASSLSLAKRVRAGLGWNISSALITESTRFLRSIILAWLLVPEDFGLFAMALTVVGALNAVSSLGLSRTIVASKFDSKNELRTYLDTVWSVELLRSFVVALLAFASAFPMAWFYGQDQLKVIVPILGSITLIGGFQNIGLALLRKQISFARIFWYELITNVAGIALTIALAIVMRNVWALVIGLLLTSTLSTVLSYAFHSYRPRLALESHAFRRIMNVGKLTLLIAVASYAVNMADNIMVGRLLGSSALGNYSLAFNIASAPISVLVLSLSGVLFPAYAEITSQRPETLEAAFTKVSNIALSIIVVMAAPMLLLAGEVVQILFGSRWTTAGTVLRILALVIPFRGFSLLVSSFFWGLNRPKLVAVATTLEALIFLAALYPLIKRFGLSGAAWAAVIAYGFGSIIRARALSQIIRGITTKLFQISLLIIAAAGTGLLIAWFSLRFVTAALPRVVIGGLLSTIIPLVILLYFKPEMRKSLAEWLS